MSNTSNPWAVHASYISVGNLRNILKVAQPTNQQETLSHVLKETMTASSLHAEGELKDQKDAVASLQQILLLKKIAELDEQLSMLQKEANQSFARKSTADLTDSKALDALVSLVEDMCHHLQNILCNKGILMTRCQEAYEDYLTIGVEYHRDLVECFPLIAKQLGELTSFLNSVTWTNQISIDDSNMSSNCRNVSSRLAMIQSFYQTLDQTRALMRTRLRKHQATTN